MSNNSFALALLYYFDYRRSKLQPDLLVKIARKYRNSPNKLLVDLQAKYEHPMLTTATLQQIIRIFSVVDIPAEYLALLPADWNCASSKYFPQCDPTRDTFDASFSLREKCLHIGVETSKLYDNMSKVKHLVPGFELAPPTVSRDAVLPTSSSSAVAGSSHSGSTELVAAGQLDKPKYVHIIHRIAQSTIESAPVLTHSQSVNNSGSGTDNRSRKRQLSSAVVTSEKSPQDSELVEAASPFQHIYNIMNEKRRACIHIRRHPNVHGFLVGFIRAFDRHYNLVLTDCDETVHYKKPANNMRPCAVVKKTKRHHPQILLRGDCVVWIARADSCTHLL